MKTSHIIIAMAVGGIAGIILHSKVVGYPGLSHLDTTVAAL